MKIVDFQKTKIVATVGPASNSYVVLKELIKAGVDVFRVNFSHGTHEDHKKVIQRITKINQELGTYTGILCDLQGPKIRVGEIMSGSIAIRSGDRITFTTKPCVGNQKKIHITYDSFAADVKAGERVLMDDGKVTLKVVRVVSKSNVLMEVISGTSISSRKGVNLPETKLSTPALTEKDEADLQFILTQPIHWIALSFVRSPKDISKLRKHITKAKHQALIVAKIEKPQAIERIERIVETTDAIMIARGDLGVEVPMEQLPTMQKRIVQLCLQKSKPCIVATQLMEGMIDNLFPTRAEILDVANAVLDGTDAVMLSAETAVGKHPVKVVEAMNKIIHEAEKNYNFKGKRPQADPQSKTYLSDTVCINSGKTANDIGAKGIASVTISGYTAFQVAAFRPNCGLFIFSPEISTLHRLALVWGTKRFYYDKFTTTDGTIEDVVTILKEKEEVKKGDYLVNTGSMPINKRFRTNFIKITLVD